MTTATMTLDDTLAAYASGLDAQLDMLQQVEALASAQRAASSCDDLAEVARLAERRGHLMEEIGELDLRLQELRAAIVAALPEARGRVGFALASRRHRDAEALIARIMDSDQALMGELEDAMIQRRRLAHSLQTGGATLAAYRRVVTTGRRSAELLDQQA